MLPRQKVLSNLGHSVNKLQVLQLKQKYWFSLRMLISRVNNDIVNVIGSFQAASLVKYGSSIKFLLNPAGL